MTDKLRAKELAKIHCGKKELGLDDDTYRAMLEQVAGVRSASELDERGRVKVIEFMRSRGAFPGDRHTATADAKPELRKIRAMLRADDRPIGYGDAIAKRMFRRDRLEWCTREELRAVIAALTVDRRRRANAEEEAPIGAEPAAEGSEP